VLEQAAGTGSCGAGFAGQGGAADLYVGYSRVWLYGHMLPTSE
jgi:hypothetical protein